MSIILHWIGTFGITGNTDYSVPIAKIIAGIIAKELQEAEHRALLLEQAGAMDRSIAAIASTVETLDASQAQLAGAMEDVAALLAGSARDVDSTGEVIETIQAIAAQTGMLGLNAAIEAAHARERGAGFAIVAEAVRKLSDQSGRSAEAVKASHGQDRKPEQAATTNPEVVATLVKLCLEAGARKVKVFDRTCNDPRRCYVQSGIEAAAKAAGAEVSFVDERRFRDVKIPGGVAIQSWPIYIDLLEADKIVSCPIAKHHGLARLTLCHKNWMGVMGENRGRIHQRLDDTLVDVATVIRPAFTVLDAVRILTAHGPQGGSAADVKRLDTVIAGTDQVAISALGATLFGLTGADIGCVREAARRGLGVMDLGQVAIRRIEG